VQILRLSKLDGSIVYKTQAAINQWRDTSNDSRSLGQISLSVYNSTMLLSLGQISPGDIRYMAVCPFNSSLNS